LVHKIREKSRTRRGRRFPQLVAEVVRPAEAEALKQRSAQLPGIDLDTRQLCDLELLLSGAFSPLEGFLGRLDYDRVVEELRLADGTLWPIPITLDVSEDFAAQLSTGSEVALRDSQGVPLAVPEAEPDPDADADTDVVDDADRITFVGLPDDSCAQQSRLSTAGRLHRRSPDGPGRQLPGRAEPCHLRRPHRARADARDHVIT